MSLNVYKASAGSGKTYTLAKNFVNLLIANPTDYKHILAVTFTNKATAEMKERIMLNLFLLAYDHKDEPLKSKRSSLLSAHVADNKHLGSNAIGVITKRCKEALVMLLNDYSQFSISTIDSFVQKVVRSFAFEAGLNASYAVELDKELILTSAIDEMMLSLKDNADLQNWLLSYMQSWLEEKSSWRIESTLLDLVKKFLDETDYKVVLGKSRSEIKAYREKMTSIVDSSKANIVEAFRQMRALCADNGVDETFFKLKTRNAIGSRVLGTCTEVQWFEYVEKNEGKYFAGPQAEAYIENSLYSKSAQSDICERFTNIMKSIEPNIIEYNTASKVKEQLYVVGILNDIQKHIETIQQRENVMPISDTSVLLSRLIDDSPVPFIYEKIGSKYKNIMIDEFQDTSHVQWDNFKPLLSNSIDQNEACLVVGDVKQAIYRWRNSDWRLLAKEIVSEFKNSVTEITLDYNYRSSANVVRFNNYIFAPNMMSGLLSMPEIMQESVNRAIASDNSDIKDIYSTSIQNLPKGKSENQGFVKVKLRPCKSSGNKGVSDDDAETPVVNVATEVAEQIAELHEKGYEYSDICILIRKKCEAQPLVAAMLEMNIPFLSSDSLLLSASPAVKAIVAHYKYMLRPNDEVALADIVSVRMGGSSISELDVDSWKKACAAERDEVLALRGYDLILMTEQIIARLPKELVHDQFIYVEAFSDCVRSYCEKKHVNLCDFVEYLGQHLDKMVINAPENQNAVTIMTIHKSKGLEFRCVLMPNVSLAINESRQDSYIWVNLPSPYDMISPYPMKYNAELLFSHAADAYRVESLMNAIDMLNILYVAFTRAVDVLVMWGERPKEEKGVEYKSRTAISEYLLCSLRKLSECGGMEMREEDAVLTFTLGETSIVEAKSEEPEQESLYIEPYIAQSWVNQIRVNNEGEKERYKSREGMVNYGNVMHSIMERVRRKEDIESAVEKAVFNGEVRAADKEEKVRMLRDKIESNAITQSWFDDTLRRVFMETTIMSQGHEYRPDRIMVDRDGKTIVIDYKFGKQHSKKYEAQVREYMQLLKEVGHDVKCGYLWYVEENNIEQITWNVE